jgi:hypothetical protein
LRFDLVPNPPKHADPPATATTHAAAQTAPTVHALAVPSPGPSPSPATTASAAPSAAATASTPEGRETVYEAADKGGPFHKVEGAPQGEVMEVDKFGATLMVEAYVVLWLLLMGWIALVWRKQAAMHTRLDDLERTIDKAAAADNAGKDKPAATPASEAEAPAEKAKA